MNVMEIQETRRYHQASLVHHTGTSAYLNDLQLVKS